MCAILTSLAAPVASGFAKKQLSRLLTFVIKPYIKEIYTHCIYFLKSALIEASHSTMNELRCLRAMEIRDLPAIERILATCQIDTSRTPKRTPPLIYYAVHTRFIEAVRLLIQAQFNVNVKSSPHFNTPLHVAARNGDSDIVHLLCEASANLNEVDVGGETALHATMDCGDQCAIEAVIVTLLSAERSESSHCNVNAKSKSGQTPLMKAVDRNCLPACRLLIDASAKLDHAAFAELQIALRVGANRELIKLLLCNYAANNNHLNCNNNSVNNRDNSQHYESSQSSTAPTATITPISTSKESPVDLAHKFSNLPAMKLAIELGFEATSELLGNPLVLLRTIVPNCHKHFEEAQFCFDYLLRFRQVDINHVAAFKYDALSRTIVINGNLLTYALTFNCSYAAARLIQIGAKVEPDCFRCYRFNYYDILPLRMLLYSGFTLPSLNSFKTRCYPTAVESADEKAFNRNAFRDFCNWLDRFGKAPKKLQEVARIVIRQRLTLRHQRIDVESDAIGKLGLPQSLCNYLAFEDTTEDLYSF